jgi:hypothetical protein
MEVIMNQSVSPVVLKPRRAPSVVRDVDLLTDEQHRLREIIRYMHGSMWPVFKSLGFRQANGTIYEAVRWGRGAEPRFSVVKWQADGCGMSWCDVKSARSALSFLRKL